MPRGGSAVLSMVPPRPAPKVDPSPDRGVVWYAEDVQRLYGERPDGAPRRSRKWLHENFCPEGRHKDGRLVWWWSHEAIAWFDRRGKASA